MSIVAHVLGWAAFSIVAIFALLTGIIVGAAAYQTFAGKTWAQRREAELVGIWAICLMMMLVVLASMILVVLQGGHLTTG